MTKDGNVSFLAILIYYLMFYFYSLFNPLWLTYVSTIPLSRFEFSLYLSSNPLSDDIIDYREFTFSSFAILSGINT